MRLLARLATAALLMTAWITACGGRVVMTSSDTAAPDDGSSAIDSSVDVDARVEAGDATIEVAPDAFAADSAGAIAEAASDSGLCSDVITSPDICGHVGGGIFTRPIDLSCAGDASADLRGYCESLGEGRATGQVLDGGVFVCFCDGPA